MDTKDGISFQKREMRKRVKKEIALLSSDYKKRAEQQIQHFFEQTSEYEQAKTVFCYVGTKDEINTKVFVEKMLKEGKKVCVPRCLDRHHMKAYYITSMEDLEEGMWGIMEPKTTLPPANRDSIDLAVIPCLTCDKNGRRLGHGAGYYDRYLEESSFSKVLFCYEKLVQEEIPVDRYDQMMDVIITEKGIFTF